VIPSSNATEVIDESNATNGNETVPSNEILPEPPSGVQADIAGCLFYSEDNSTCNQCNAQSLLSEAGDMCECVFKYSLSFSNVTDENGDSLESIIVDNNLVFTSDILTDNTPFNCLSLLSLNVSGSSDNMINSALQSEFESQQCSVL
jgi:hypothetical protein